MHPKQQNAIISAFKPYDSECFRKHKKQANIHYAVKMQISVKNDSKVRGK